jgi:hypothetical protein
MDNLETFVRETLDPVWNRQDPAGALALFAEDVAISVSPAPPGVPGTFNGREGAEAFIGIYMPGCHVSSRNFSQSGPQVRWNASVSADGLRALGVDLAELTASARVQEGKILSFEITFSPQTLAQIEAAQKKEVTA